MYSVKCTKYIVLFLCRIGWRSGVIKRRIGRRSGSFTFVAIFGRSTTFIAGFFCFSGFLGIFFFLLLSCNNGYIFAVFKSAFTEHGSFSVVCFPNTVLFSCFESTFLPDTSVFKIFCPLPILLSIYILTFRSNLSREKVTVIGSVLNTTQIFLLFFYFTIGVILFLHPLLLVVDPVSLCNLVSE